MAVRLRLQRTGRKNRPSYRLVAADSRWPRDGRSLEVLGVYNPIAKEESENVTLKEDRIKHWLSEGARPTEKVAALLKRSGIEV
ncbi:30S ribosomal protein S16 [Planctomycetota bacterium]